MDAMGQMGNADEATMSDDLPFNESDLIVEEEDTITEMNRGGDVYNKYMADAGIQMKRFVNPETGDVQIVRMVNGIAIPAVKAGYVPEGQASKDTIEESLATNTPEPVKQQDREDAVSYFEGQPVSSGRSIDITDDMNADSWSDLGAEGMFGKAVDQSKAPAGWTTQNQREYQAFKDKNLTVKAMWNGSDWDVYSPELKGTAYGDPGFRGFQSKYPNQLKTMFGAVKTGATSPLTGFKGFTDMTSNIHKSFVSGLEGAISPGNTKRDLSKFSKVKSKGNKKQDTIKGIKVGSKDFATNIQKKIEAEKASKKAEQADKDKRAGTIIQSDKDKKDFKTGTGIDIDKGTDIKDTGITSDQMQYGLKRGGLASKK